MAKKFKFKYIGHNRVLDFEEFRVSYNKDPSGGKSNRANQLNSDETALVENTHGIFYIICGDLRKAIEKCSTFNEVVNVFYNSEFPLSKRSDIKDKETLLTYKQ